MNPTDTPAVETTSEDNKRITIELSPGGAIGCQISNMTPIRAARLMLQAADIVLSGVEDRPFIEQVEEMPDLRREMQEIEALMNVGGKGQ